MKIEVLNFNLVWFEKFAFQGYSIICKLTIAKQGMTDWLGSDEKTTSDSSLKLTFYKGSSDAVRKFWYQFGMIWDICVPGVLIWLKISHYKIRNGELTEQRHENEVRKQL